MKTTLFVFIIALALNLIWEHFHFKLYDCSIGCTVNTFSFLPLPLLVRASFFDAFFITGIYLFIAAIHRSLAWISSWQTLDTMLITGIAMTVASVIERNAITTHKWAYAPAMPIVPFLEVGLSPFLQLALLALSTYTVARIVFYYF